MNSYPASFTFISDEVSQDPAIVMAFARRHGFGGIELRSMFGRAFRDLTAADVALIAHLMADSGLKVYGCATPVFKCPISDAAQRREHRDLFRRSVEVAQALECPLLRVFTFLRNEQPVDAAALARAADHVNGLLEFCPEGLRLGVENEASCLVGTGAELELFLRNGADDRLVVIWDPCNVLYVPGHAGRAVDGFSRFVARIGHVHVKDAARGPEAIVACRMGEGEVGWERHFQLITASGYTGLFSLETHWRMQALGSDALHLPGGFGFSQGGEAASEACLEAIRRMW